MDVHKKPKVNDMTWLFVSITVFVVFVGITLAVALVHTNKNNVEPSTTKYERPAPTPQTSTNAGIKRGNNTCSPVSLVNKENGEKAYTGLVACTSQADCVTGCKEEVEGFPYSCVTVQSGNNATGNDGKLVVPMIVPFQAPLVNRPCNGRGTLNGTVCKCDPDFSGENCEMYNMQVNTPGMFCLPPYMNKCDNATSDTVLMNLGGPNGVEWACQCKSKYLNLFTQKVEGGDCNVPLVCDATSVQKNAELEAQLFSVYDSLGPDGEPVFQDKTVIPNRIVTYNALTEPCVAKTKGLKTYNHDAGLEYKVVLDDAVQRDPTCEPLLHTNFCQAAAGNVGGKFIVAPIRGSGTVKDPLLMRTDPPFFEPVPPALQRCPDHFSGSNTKDDPCKCACVNKNTDLNRKCCDGRTPDCVPCDNMGQPLGANDYTCECAPDDKLFMRTTKKAYCGSDEYPSSDKEFVDTWYSSVFDVDGEWNGAFSCLHDLSYAQMAVQRDSSGPFTPAEKTLTWRTLLGRNSLKPVYCYDSSNYFIDRNSYDSESKRFVDSSSNCVGAKCTGGQGAKVAEWNSARDGPLVDDANHDLPWFATNNGLYGGQCECKGVSYITTDYNDGSDPVSVPVPLLPQYWVPAEGEESWWTCAMDACSISSRNPPLSHFDTENENTLFPKCVCSMAGTKGMDAPLNVNDPSMGPPYTSEISFREQSIQVPRCISDPCNPGGMKTRTKIPCSDSDESPCRGTCYKNACYYAVPTGTCNTDADCVNNNLTYNQAQAPVVCASKQDKDGNVVKQCLVADVDRYMAGSTCEQDGDCDNGMCTDLDANNAGFCSGGCACKRDMVQQHDNENPVGFTCQPRCTVYPCANDGKCSIDNHSGKKVCECTPCFQGDVCQKPTRGSQHNQLCKHGYEKGKNDELLRCCDPIYSSCKAGGSTTHTQSCQK